jgi:hypothetical protein
MDILIDISRADNPFFSLLERRKIRFFWNFQERNTLPLGEKKPIFLLDREESSP